MIRVSPFRRDFDRSGFACAIGELDDYLKRQVSQDVKRNAAACFILHEAGSTEIRGYYTLSAHSLALETLPEALQKMLPRYSQVPATLLGRLAIARQWQGKGLGELLLLDALRRAWENREVIGSWAVVVDTINEEAERFYRHFNFRTGGMAAGRLFLSMGEIGKLL